MIDVLLRVVVMVLVRVAVMLLVVVMMRLVVVVTVLAVTSLTVVAVVVGRPAMSDSSGGFPLVGNVLRAGKTAEN